MEQKQNPSKMQEDVTRIAQEMVDAFMPCDGLGMILGYAAILVLERGIRADMPPQAAQLAREIAGTIRADMKKEEQVWQDEK